MDVPTFMISAIRGTDTPFSCICTAISRSSLAALLPFFAMRIVSHNIDAMSTNLCSN